MPRLPRCIFSLIRECNLFLETCLGASIVGEVEVKKGSRKLGFFYTLDTGEVIYVATRQHKHIYRSSFYSISAAMQEDQASWGIDDLTLLNLRARGIPRIGVNVVDTGDFYLGAVADYFDRTKFKLRDYTGVGRGGSRQRYVSLSNFQVFKARVTLSIKRTRQKKSLEK